MSASFAPLYVTLSYLPTSSAASASSLNVESLRTAPREVMDTSVGGSVNVWRMPTSAAPLRASARLPIVPPFVSASGLPPSRWKR